MVLLSVRAHLDPLAPDMLQSAAGLHRHDNAGNATVLQRLKRTMDSGVPAGVLGIGLCVLAIVAAVIGDNPSRSAPLSSEPAEAVNAVDASPTKPNETKLNESVDQRMDGFQHRLEEVEKRLPKTVPDPKTPDPHPPKIEKAAKIAHLHRHNYSCCCPSWWW
jgi:hypothetical protein